MPVNDASCCVTGLYSSFWIVSLCPYFRIPSAAAVQMIMDLSALPEANRSPSLDQSTQ